MSETTAEERAAMMLARAALRVAIHSSKFANSHMTSEEAFEQLLKGISEPAGYKILRKVMRQRREEE